MRPPRWKALIEKSIAACCAAIEIYNKPVVPHREETFAILVTAAWELLLKARLVKENRNQLKAIFETEPARRKDGTPTARRRIRRNKAGNPVTIGIGTAMDRASGLKAKPLDGACRRNLELLIEVRNNAVHFVNEDRELALRVHEIGVAALRNYAAVLSDWFDHDLTGLRFAILPLSFDGMPEAQVLPARKRSAQAQNLLRHLSEAVGTPSPSADARFSVALRVEARIVGTGAADAVPVKLGKGPDAVVVELTEQEFLKRWPLTYDEMVAKVRSRVPGLKRNRDFHELVRELKADERYAKDRRLNLKDPNSKSVKPYFSQAMVDALVNRLSGASPAAAP